MPGGSRIYPAATTQRMLEKEIGSSVQSANVTISGNTFVIREEEDMDKIAYKIAQQFIQAQLNYSGV